MTSKETSTNSKKKQLHSSKSSTAYNKLTNTTNPYSSDLRSSSSIKKKIKYFKFKKLNKISMEEYCKQLIEFKDK